MVGLLRRLDAPVLVVANKVDDIAHEARHLGPAAPSGSVIRIRSRHCTGGAPVICSMRSSNPSPGRGDADESDGSDEPGAAAAAEESSGA